MSNIGSLLSEIGAGCFQQAYVVADVARAQEALTETLGCERWATLPAADLEYDFRGGRTTCALEIAFARSGNMQIELLQPVRGNGLHVEFLESNGPGLHHLGFLVDDIDAVVAHAASLGYARVQGATFGSLTFCYLDTWDDWGLYVELVEDPDGMMMGLMPWR
jgi:catechol 2,3-dioxygenase-like lactoylglutathione lyase family enzyme